MLAAIKLARSSAVAIALQPFSQSELSFQKQVRATMSNLRWLVGNLNSNLDLELYFINFDSGIQLLQEIQQLFIVELEQQKAS